MTDDARTRALVDRAKSGDHDAFAALYRQLDPKIRNFVGRRMVGDPFAEDLVSATWERVWRRLPTFNHLDGHEFGGWVTTIARNLIADYYKSSRYRQERLTFDGTVDPELFVENQVDQWVEETQRRWVASVVRTAVAGLTMPAQRQVVRLRELDELSVPETADRLNMTRAAVKAAHFRARRHLARALVGVA